MVIGFQVVGPLEPYMITHGSASLWSLVRMVCDHTLGTSPTTSCLHTLLENTPKVHPPIHLYTGTLGVDGTYG